MVMKVQSKADYDAKMAKRRIKQERKVAKGSQPVGYQIGHGLKPNHAARALTMDSFTESLKRSASKPGLTRAEQEAYEFAEALRKAAEAAEQANG
jgi:hypothetical protein